MLSCKQLENILPQSSPMLMIDTLILSDSKKTQTQLTISVNNIFVSEGKLREPGIIENMAQTAAARAGYEALKNKTKVKTGYIGSIKNLIIHTLPEINNTLLTILTPVSEIGTVSLINTEVFCNKQKVAECSMTIFLVD